MSGKTKPSNHSVISPRRGAPRPGRPVGRTALGAFGPALAALAAAGLLLAMALTGPTGCSQSQPAFVQGGYSPAPPIAPRPVGPPPQPERAK